MIICNFCGHYNREGELFCQECASPLIMVGGTPQTAHISTQRLQSTTTTMGGQSAKRALWGTSKLRKDSTIVVHIKGQAEPVVLQPKPELIVGRRDVQTNHYPDLDLTPYGAIEEGVSRMHASFQYTDNSLTLADTGSVNGTYLNGQQLASYQPRIIHDGDEVRFGKLTVHIYFK